MITFIFQVPGPSVLLKAPPKGKNAEGDEEEEEDYDAKIVSTSNYKVQVIVRCK